MRTFASSQRPERSLAREDEQLITTISLINLKTPLQESRSHPLSNVAQRSSVACEEGNFKNGDFIFSGQLRQKNSLGGRRLTVGCTVPHVVKLWSGGVGFFSGCSGGQRVLKQQQ